MLDFSHDFRPASYIDRSESWRRHERDDSGKRGKLLALVKKAETKLTMH
jgi:hypothetical protein